MRGAEKDGNADEEAWILPFPTAAARGQAQKRTWNVRRREPKTLPDRLFQRESFVAPPTDSAEPYTLQWYLAIEHLRHQRQARWLPELLEFGKHPGELILGLGHGLGTDLVQYAREGARVIACSPHTEELSLIRRNFELRGLHARFTRANPRTLPLADASVDVVLVTGLIHEAAEPAELIAEIFRVLKPGGKVVAVVPAKYRAAFWLPFLTFQGNHAGHDQSAASFSNPSTIDVGQLASGGLSRRRLKKLFSSFTNYRIHKRHIRRRDLPWITRCVPRAWLERCLGSFLILKAFKPVSLAAQRAAA